MHTRARQNHCNLLRIIASHVKFADFLQAKPNVAAHKLRLTYEILFYVWRTLTRQPWKFLPFRHNHKSQSALEYDDSDAKWWKMGPNFEQCGSRNFWSDVENYNIAYYFFCIAADAEFFFVFFFCSSCCFSLCILIPSSAHANAPHMLNAHSEHKSMDYVAAANGSGRGFPLVSSYNFHLFSITIPHPSMCICMEHTTHFSQLELRAILEFEHIFSEALAALPITQIAACVCVLCDIGKKK